MYSLRVFVCCILYSMLEIVTADVGEQKHLATSWSDPNPNPKIGAETLSDDDRVIIPAGPAVAGVRFRVKG